MWPFHVKLGPFALSPVELFAFLGLALVVALARPRVRALGVSDGGVLDLALAALVGGAVGARLFYFVPLWLRGLESGVHLFSRWSEGSGFYGGLLGGMAGVAVLARLRKQPVLDILDASFPPFPLGFGVGKVGCFLAGCCYGSRCGVPPGVAFAPGSLAYNTQLKAREIPAGATSSLAVHPAQLYELALGLALFAGLLWLRRRNPPRGALTCAFLAGYSVWRFAIEFLRDDPGRHGFNAGISDSQIMALIVFAAAVVAWVRLRQPAPERRHTL
jgi:phosphatidylglycerol:prolipoprotein diacylglycerol transferase